MTNRNHLHLISLEQVPKFSDFGWENPKIPDFSYFSLYKYLINAFPGNSRFPGKWGRKLGIGICLLSRSQFLRAIQTESNRLFAVKTEQKIALFYLLNDVVQHAKRKNHTELLEKFQSVMKEAMPHLKDDAISGKVNRCLNIWSERAIFSERVIETWKTQMEPKKKEDQEIVDNFQPHQLCTQIKILKALEDDSGMISALFFGFRAMTVSDFRLQTGNYGRGVRA